MAKGLLPTLLPTLSPTLTLSLSLSLKKIAIANVNVIVIVFVKKHYAYEKVYVYSIILGSNPLRCCRNGDTSTRSYRWLGTDSCSTTLRAMCHVPRHKRSIPAKERIKPLPAKERINGGGIYTNNWLEVSTKTINNQ